MPSMVQRIVRVAIVSIAVVGSAVRAQSSTASDSVRAVAQGIIAADNARDIARVMSFYADDAVLLPPNESPVTGRPAIRPRYEALFASTAPSIVTALDEVRVAGTWAFVRGRNTGFMRPIAGGQDRPLNDVFLMVLQRAPSGEWKIARLIWHRASP